MTSRGPDATDTDWERMLDASPPSSGEPRRIYRIFGNLDTLLTFAYLYHARRGFWCVCSEYLTYVLTIGFTTLYAPLLLLCVDWLSVMHCQDASECVIFRYMGGEFTTSGWVGAGLFLSMCAGFLIWNVAYCALAIRRFDAIRRLLLLVDRSDASLQCEWSDACEHIASIVEMLHVPELRRRLSMSDINQRITRNDAFMSAFVHQALFDCPSTPVRFSQARLTKTLEWSISRCIFAGMVRPDGTLNAAFVHAPHRLRWQFRVLGCVMAVVSPFLFVFICIYYFLKYAEYVYKNPIYMATRRWSPYARLRMRVHGELPHLMSSRLTLAYKYVDLFIGKYPHHLPCIWGRFVAFILGSFVGTILVIGVLSERALLFRIGEHDLLWVLALLSAVILFIRSSTEIPQASHEAVDVDLSKLQSYMRHVPRNWHVCSSDQVALDLQRLCPPVALFFLHELLGILTTPLHLYFSISYRASEIVAFVQARSTTVENVGVICQPNYENWEM